MDKFQFAKLVSFVTSLMDHGNYRIDQSQLEILDDLVKSVELNFPIVHVKPSDVNELLRAMAMNEKISAIKAYRTLTGEGLKESKDAVERYLVAKPYVDNRPDIGSIIRKSDF